MYDNFKDFQNQLNDVEKDLSKNENISNQQKYQTLTKDHARLTKIVNDYKAYLRLSQDYEEAKNLLNDIPDEGQDTDYLMLEIQTLEAEVKSLELKLKAHLIPASKNDDKDVIVEIRAGTGGDEASIFAADLFRMYSKYVEKNDWKLEIFNSNRTAGNKGFKEIIFSIQGDQVYARLCFESGVHRVQRIPVTEASGRIHTSAATVFVMPEADEVEVEIDPKDIRIDVFRASGCGGQHVNTTDSAVRIVHIPSNIVVSCQDEKSQIKNKAKAMRVLRARLKDLYEGQENDRLSEERKLMILSGDRSEKIRTYNFPQNRITDHRIKLSVHNLLDVLEGALDELIDGLLTNYVDQFLDQ